MKKNAILFLATLLIGGCATGGQTKNDDKFESYNRAVFDFNTKVDDYVLKPIAKGYINITSEGVRKSVSSIFANILEPLSAANHLLQGNIQGTGINISRFVINTTAGGLGAFDVAKKMGLEPDASDFDDTLAHWCVADGPYIVLPLLGSATPRTISAKIVNAYANPVTIATNSIGSEGTKNTIKYSYQAARIIVARANAMPITDDLEKNSVDYYTAVRAAFLQNQGKTKCFLKKDEVSYDFDFNEYE